LLVEQGIQPHLNAILMPAGVGQSSESGGGGGSVAGVELIASTTEGTSGSNPDSTPSQTNP